jgi:pyruvate dehydrogenase E2 component (dihydrolipoamide acetyltransferase)
LVGAKPWTYVERGPTDGPAMVLVHGFGGDLGDWSATVPALEGIARIIVVDLPGHGGSSKAVDFQCIDDLARRLAGFLDAIGVERAHLVGHCLGGGIIALMALARPGLCESLTLIAPVGLGDEIDAEHWSGCGTEALRSIRDAMASGGNQRVSLLPELVRLDVPVRIIWGAEDRIVPAAHAGGLPSHFKVNVFDGAGHMVHRERAKEVNAILAESIAA